MARRIYLLISIMGVVILYNSGTEKKRVKIKSSSSFTIQTDEMKWFEDFVGEWVLEEKVQFTPDAPVTKSEKTSRIYFLPDRKTLAVEDVSKDGNNFFLGFHAYDSENERYINWGAASTFYEGWGHGSINKNGELLHLSGQAFDPRDPKGSVFKWSGDWIKKGKNKHIFRAYVSLPDRGQHLFKESIYTRK